MTFTPEQEALLKAPLDRAHVATRSQSGRNLSYVEGWHCIAEANHIFGFAMWDRETVDLRVVAERERKIGQALKDGWGVSYLARVKITVVTPDGSEIIREGCGSGHGIDVDLGLAHESAAKEAETDAMKRALMTFGNPFGLALYDKTQASVVDTPAEPPPPKIDPAAFFDRWQRMLAQAVTAEALSKVRADTVPERAEVDEQDKAMTTKINDAFKRRRAELAAANTNTPGNHQTAISAG